MFKLNHTGCSRLFISPDNNADSNFLLLIMHLPHIIITRTASSLHRSTLASRAFTRLCMAYSSKPQFTVLHSPFGRHTRLYRTRTIVSRIKQPIVRRERNFISDFRWSCCVTTVAYSYSLPMGRMKQQE